jgi:hypothetical protein
MVPQNEPYFPFRPRSIPIPQRAVKTIHHPLFTSLLAVSQTGIEGKIKTIKEASKNHFRFML